MPEERLTAEERAELEWQAIRWRVLSDDRGFAAHQILRLLADLNEAEARLATSEQKERDTFTDYEEAMDMLSAERKDRNAAEAALAELAAAVDPNGYHRRSPCICPECLRLRAALAAAEGQPVPPTAGG